MGYKFHIDRFDQEVLSGWIFLEEAPIQKVQLALCRKGKVLRTFAADQIRPDLELKGIGVSGECSFELPLASLIDAQDLTPLELRLSDSGFVVASSSQNPCAIGEFNSDFGGLWIDRKDFLKEAQRRIECGSIPPSLVPHILDFALKGYTIFPKAVDQCIIDRINEDVDQLWQETPARATIETYQVNNELSYIPVRPELKMGKNKLLDLYAFSEAARHAIFQPRLAKFLECLFDGPVTAFQSLSFILGSEQAMHKDTAFVRVFPPNHVAASWLALEDVSEGTGELEYYVGSHHDPEFLFGEKHKWMFRHPEDLAAYLESLHEDARVFRHRRERFLPRAGDVLVWHANLTHGGSTIFDQNKTRKSLVTHYCPSQARPFYQTGCAIGNLEWGPHRFTSGIVDLEVSSQQKLPLQTKSCDLEL